jgi:dTDP-4-amino-4,6-dideoxygalactose transaminase
MDDLDRGGHAARPWLPPALQGRQAGRVKVVMPVHVFGQPAEMPALLAASDRHGVAVVEDACEAPGAEHDGRVVGSFGAAGVFGFYPNKQMTTGEGGLVVTREAEWARVMRSLRNQGRDDDGTWLRHVRLGYNYRLDDISAALGIGQLEKLDEILALRASVARRYGELLAGVEGVELPCADDGDHRRSWFVYVVALPDNAARERVIAHFEREGIGYNRYLPSIHLQGYMRERYGFREGMCPVSEDASARTLALPFFTGLEPGAQERVAEALAAAL